MAEAAIQVTVCWSLQPRQVHEHTLSVPAHSTVDAAVDAAIQQLGQLPNIDMTPAQWSRLKFLVPGIWGRKAEWHAPVREGDRIELYRPLKVDPKVARRQRFKGQGKGRTGLFANRKRGAAAGY